MFDRDTKAKWPTRPLGSDQVLPFVRAALALSLRDLHSATPSQKPLDLPNHPAIPLKALAAPAPGLSYPIAARTNRADRFPPLSLSPSPLSPPHSLHLPYLALPYPNHGLVTSNTQVREQKQKR